jgi:hypothetical protein
MIRQRKQEIKRRQTLDQTPQKNKKVKTPPERAAQESR